MPIISFIGGPKPTIKEHHKCYACDSTEKLKRHRIRPGEYGGTYDPSNVCILCHGCHTLVHRFIRYTREDTGLKGYEFFDFCKAARNFKLEQKKEKEELENGR